MGVFLNSRRVLDLPEPFRDKVVQLLKQCRDAGIEMQPYATLRGPGDQAKLWCQSRSENAVRMQATAMEKVGAPWLASLLKPEYCKGMARVTNALPGLSWHQWGEAVDCVVLDAKKTAIWNTEHRGWKIYIESAASLSLNAGGFWKSLPDWPHVQLRRENSPLQAGFSWPQIDAEMKLRFGN